MVKILNRFAARKSWIVGGLLGMLAAITLSLLSDLADGRGLGSTIVSNLASPRPFPVVVSGVGLLIWLGLIFFTYYPAGDKSVPPGKDKSST